MKDYVLNLDKPRKLKFGFKATRLINEKFKKRDLTKLVEFALEEFIFLAWAGLMWEDESLKEEDVERLLDEKIGVEYSQNDIANIVAEAMTAHSGVKPEKKKVSETIPSKKHAKSHLKSA
ncbi:hypothetical protein ES703_114824 [subsurface metagenome]